MLNKKVLFEEEKVVQILRKPALKHRSKYNNLPVRWQALAAVSNQPISAVRTFDRIRWPHSVWLLLPSTPTKPPEVPPSQNIHHAQPPPPLFTRFLLPQQIQRNATAGGVSYSRELVLWPFLFRAAVGRWVFFPMGAHNRECSTGRPVSSTTDTNWHTNKPKAELAACWEREVGGEGGEGVPGQGLPTILLQGSNDQSRKSGKVHTPFSIAANWFSISEGGLGKI